LRVQERVPKRLGTIGSLQEDRRPGMPIRHPLMLSWDGYVKTKTSAATWRRPPRFRM